MSKPAEKRKFVFENASMDERQLLSLLDVGRALSAEQETSRILDLILEKALENTQADGASIYLIEKHELKTIAGTRPIFEHKLRFYKSLTRSRSILQDRVIPINNESVAGYVATHGDSLRVRDCYTLPPDSPFKFNPAFDKENNYRTKSMLCVPMKTNKGKIIGVVQLVNKLRPHRRKTDAPIATDEKLQEKQIIAFSDHDSKLVETFAAQGAIALDNAKLTRDIEKLFESFVKASVSAIEARDPTTSGHSDRVAILTVEFAKIIDKIQVGQFKEIKFRPEQFQELRYAALLHDFGKIGVREHVLTKARKLYPHELETVLLRLETMKAKKEAHAWREAAEILSESIHNLQSHVHDAKCDHGNNCVHNKDSNEVMSRSLWQIDQFSRKLEQIRTGILQANETQILSKDFDINTLIMSIKVISQNMGQDILTEDETHRLSVSRGSLSGDERKQIESHVSHTYEFLRQIAWTEDLAEIPNIAHAHHEKLNGAGYPLGLKGDEIPVQSRMMTVADIYDALTAMDRPYKKAATPERAIEILYLEADEGQLDKSLVKVFVESEIYKLTAHEKIKKAA